MEATGLSTTSSHLVAQLLQFLNTFIDVNRVVCLSKCRSWCGDCQLRWYALLFERSVYPNTSSVFTTEVRNSDLSRENKSQKLNLEWLFMNVIIRLNNANHPPFSIFFFFRGRLYWTKPLSAVSNALDFSTEYFYILTGVERKKKSANIYHFKHT